MRILAITNMLPSADAPTSGVFVEQQINGLMSIGLKVHTLLVDRRKYGVAAYYRMEPAIRAAVASFKPDLVHVMYGGVMADKIASSAGLPPVIITFHGSDLLGENLSGWLRKLISHYGVHCSRKAAGNAAGIVVVARHLLNVLPKSLNHEKIRVIPCGIDLTRFKPLDTIACKNRLGWSQSEFHVLFASANNDQVKRPWLAQAAVDAAIHRGVPARLHRLSGIPNDDVPVWLNAGDALILTSLHEGSPTVVKESLACRLPVVSLDVGDVVERLQGIAGCYLAASDPNDLAAALAKVYTRRQRLPEDCAWISELSHIRIAERLSQFYREVLSLSNSCEPQAQAIHSEMIRKF